MKALLFLVFIFLSVQTQAQMFVFEKLTTQGFPVNRAIQVNDNHLKFFESCYALEQKGYHFDRADEEAKEFVPAYVAYTLLKAGLEFDLAVKETKCPKKFFNTLKQVK